MRVNNGELTFGEQSVWKGITKINKIKKKFNVYGQGIRECFRQREEQVHGLCTWIVHGLIEDQKEQNAVSLKERESQQDDPGKVHRDKIMQKSCSSF